MRNRAGCQQDKVYHVGEMRFQPNGGPAAVRHSTITHRLTAEMMVLRIENKADFEEMRQAFEDEYRPVGPTEEFYLDIMLAAGWRMRRARKIEAGLYALRLQALEEQSLTGFSDTTRRDQLIHHDATGTVAELLRYQAKLKRDFNRSRGRLLELQAEWAQSQSNLTNQSVIIYLTQG